LIDAKFLELPEVAPPRNGTSYAAKTANQILEKFMIRCFSKRFALLSSVVVSLAFPGGVFGTFITFSVGGNASTASIEDTVNLFRAALGDPNNGNAAGPLASGRREINWDGGGNNANSPGGTPFNVFLNTRGAQFKTPGTGFLQAPPGPPDPLTAPDGGFDTAFGNSNLSDIFGVFSPLRIFSPVGSNITDGLFFIPGTNGSDPATVSGFGAIFTDVDLATSTRLQFFGTSNNLLFDEFVPSGSGDKSFSFLGAVGDAGEEIFRVRITSGNTPIGPNVSEQMSGVDLVAMDDFLFAEPRRVPESGSGVALMGLGLGFVLFCYRRSLAVS
jgi:hypothetical protein